MDSGKPSSSAGAAHCSAGSPQLAPKCHQITGRCRCGARTGHTPCFHVPAGQILSSTSASEEFMGESCGLTGEIWLGPS